MSCAMVAADLVDVARGGATDSQRFAVDRHARDCAACAARLERERALSAGLRRLAEDTVAPPPDADRESALLRAFDASWAREPIAHSDRRWVAGTLLAAMAATIAWTVVRVPATLRLPPVPAVVAAPQPPAPPLERRLDARNVEAAPVAASSARRPVVRRSSPAPLDPPPFVAWPGADDLPTFESGQLLRLELPASIVVSIGLTPATNADVVQADVLVDQAGYARAVRLVP